MTELKMGKSYELAIELEWKKLFKGKIKQLYHWNTQPYVFICF